MTSVCKRYPKEKLPKLEIYIGMLRLFASTGPIEIGQAHALSKNDRKPDQFACDVDFLVKERMIQTDERRKRVVCSLTDRGKRILSYFEMLPSTLDFGRIQDLEDESFEDNEADGEDEEDDGEGCDEVEDEGDDDSGDDDDKCGE